MNGLNAGVAGKVAGIEGEDFCDSASHHDRDETGIVSLNAKNPVCSDEIFPFLVGITSFFQYAKDGFESDKFSAGIFDCHSEAIFHERPCGHIPKFSHVLRRDC